MELKSHHLNDKDYLAKYAKVVRTGGDWDAAQMYTCLASARENTAVLSFCEELVDFYRQQALNWYSSYDQGAVHKPTSVGIRLPWRYAPMTAKPMTKGGIDTRIYSHEDALAIIMKEVDSARTIPEYYALFYQGIIVDQLWCAQCGGKSSRQLVLHYGTPGGPVSRLWFKTGDPDVLSRLQHHYSGLAGALVHMAGICTTCTWACAECQRPLDPNFDIKEVSMYKSTGCCRECGRLMLVNIEPPKPNLKQLHSFRTRMIQMGGGRRG